MTYNPAEYGDLWADLYDQEHDWKNPASAVKFLSDMAGDGAVLELGIGTGRLALPLAKQGIRIAGVDSSEAMVARMRQKPGGADITVIVGDMATCDLGGPYEVVFVAFNTIFGLGDQERQIDCFKNVGKALVPGGRFVLECFVPDLRRFQEGNQAVRVLPTSTSERLRLNASLHFPDQQRVDTHVVIVQDGRVDVLPVSLRYIWPAEMDVIARLVGFEPESRFGDWSWEPFTADSIFHISVYRRGLGEPESEV